MNTQGIITRTSPYDVKETIDRLVVLLEKHGATIYSRINQQSEARHAGKDIFPVEFLLFGNPANGSTIMETNPLAALDLPLKILAWEGTDQVVRVSFNDPVYIQKRYSLPIQLVVPLNLTPLIDKALA
ncbi:DUF302 domain-containing protein [Mucilaginibacter sp. X4EP1]|uniref:DUF302 domain-containing protein n=1 Tax=Mucilaginibacter sp. X4EP1 TaxID=2723092 RepID=UPI00216A80FA|nr:DUF302 domain-containing protein [Mucilaginibacter sp. X4EP1]